MAHKKILHVVSISFVLPFILGNQIDYFREKGFDISISCSPSNDLFEFAKVKGVDAIPLKIKRGFSPLIDIFVIFKLIRIITARQFDVVVGHTPKGAFIAMIAASICGVKRRIYFRHGIFYETSFGFKMGLFKFVEKVIAMNSHLVVCVSPSVLEVSNRDKLNPRAKNALLNKGSCNGVDANYFDPHLFCKSIIDSLKSANGIKNDDFVVGYVGRMVKDKGIEELIMAWHLFSLKYRDVKLLLIGPFEKRNALNFATVGQIRSNSSIIHINYIKDVRPYYAAMNVFILPSYREGFPTVTLEAAAMCLPIITSKATGCSDSIIGNFTGLFTAIEATNIFHNIEHYYLNNDLAVRHGLNGRNRIINDFNQVTIWKEIEQKVFTL